MALASDVWRESLYSIVNCRLSIFWFRKETVYGFGAFWAHRFLSKDGGGRSSILWSTILRRYRIHLQIDLATSYETDRHLFIWAGGSGLQPRKLVDGSLHMSVIIDNWHAALALCDWLNFWTYTAVYLQSSVKLCLFILKIIIDPGYFFCIAFWTLSLEQEKINLLPVRCCILLDVLQGAFPETLKTMFWIIRSLLAIFILWNWSSRM